MTTNKERKMFFLETFVPQREIAQVVQDTFVLLLFNLKFHLWKHLQTCSVVLCFCCSMVTAKISTVTDHFRANCI